MAPSESHRSRVERERERERARNVRHPGFSPFSFFFRFFSFLPPLPHLHFCFRPLPLFLFFARARGRVARICFSAPLFCSALFYFLLFFCLFFCFHRNRGALRGAPLLKSLSIPAPTRKSMMSISLLSPPILRLRWATGSVKKLF